MTDRRTFIRSILVVAATPMIPLLAQAQLLPGGITYLQREVVKDFNSFCYAYRAIACCDGEYAAVVVMCESDPRESASLMHAIGRDAEAELRRFFTAQKKHGLR